MGGGEGAPPPAARKPAGTIPARSKSMIYSFTQHLTSSPATDTSPRRVLRQRVSVVRVARRTSGNGVLRSGCVSPPPWAPCCHRPLRSCVLPFIHSTGVREDLPHAGPCTSAGTTVTADADVACVLAKPTVRLLCTMTLAAQYESALGS